MKVMVLIPEEKIKDKEEFERIKKIIID